MIAAATDEWLEMWVVYDHPGDMPDCFVARKWLIGRGRTEATKAIRAAGTLAEVRAMLPDGLICVARSEGDEAQIVETWM